MFDVTGLEPNNLWSHFAEILAIPRPSGHEGEVREYILRWAGHRDFRVGSDSAGNLFVDVPALEGSADREPVMIQAHMDMVADKERDVEIDFFRDGIEAFVDGDFVRSRGTTLGADNGIGLAAAMAISEDESFKRGPLQLIFTVDEERGLTGAKGLDANKLRGSRLLNLDSEDEAIYIGCAGAEDCLLRFPCNFEELTSNTIPVEVSVEGVEGGHSGVDIGRNGANAIKLLARLLDEFERNRANFRLVSVRGGSSRNAIPREATALGKVPTTSLGILEACVRVEEVRFRREYPRDLGIRLAAVRVPKRRKESGVWGRESQAIFIRAVMACPHGVLGMSNDVDGLVETSNNLALLRIVDQWAEIQTLTRSSGEGGLWNVTEEIRALAELSGAAFSRLGGYPAWHPNPQSSLVKVASRAFVHLHTRPPELRAVHAGLECGIIGSKIEGLEMISLGPEINGAHTPRENVRISSVAKFYKLLREVLRELVS